MDVSRTMQAMFFMVLLFHLRPAYSACPRSLLHACQCYEESDGFFVACQDVNGDLDTVLEPLGRLHIKRLTVYGAHWPVLKRLPPVWVKAIALVSCGIEKVEDMAFQQAADHLEELVLANNSLSTIPKFGDLHNLLALNLKYNKISNIAEDAFQNMTSLAQLRLDANEICSIPRNAFREIKGSLELLDVSGNCLDSIPVKSLRGLPQLMYLDLSENRIASIGDYGFRDLPSLKEVRLGNNIIEKVGTLAFKDVPQLKVLSLQHNLLSKFDAFATVEGFRELEVLDISDNQLLEVPSLKKLPNILQVRLECNRIKHIERNAFSGNPRMRHLGLENNEISTLSPHCFNNLHGLTHLLLSNNSLRSIDRDVFSGMLSLEQLSLQSNSLNELENHTFDGIPQLKMLDLSCNSIHEISTDAFKDFVALVYVDLSHNLITTFKKGTFVASIPNIILFGNPIQCDDNADWLVQYLIISRVRTHLPFQSEVMCASPAKYATVRLRDFLEKKANDTLNGITSALRMATGGSSGQGIFNLIPASMRKLLPVGERTEGNDPLANVPVIGAITRALPGLRSLPGLSYLPQATGEQAVQVRSFNDAVEKFSSPLIRVLTGESHSLADIDQMVQAIPNLAANLPGLGNVDLTNLPPPIVLNILRGGQIPGVKKETLERIVKEHLSKMYEAAAAARSGRPQLDETRYLPPLESLPKELIAEMMKGGSLPYLTKEQMALIKSHYVTRVAAALSRGESNVGLPEGINTQQLKSMMKLLPPNYDISKIPIEVIETVAEGRIPDINALPQDLQDYILNNSLANGGTDKKPELSANDILRNHKSAESPIIPESEQYDINKVSADLIKAEEQAKRKQRLLYCSYILLGVVAAVSLVVMVFLYRYMKHRRAVIAERRLDSLCNSEAIIHQGSSLIVPSRSRNGLTGKRPHFMGPIVCNQETFALHNNASSVIY